jgi:cobalamin biosynthesis protein CobT
MSRLNTALERALPIVAAAYGDQFGVGVTLSGDDARTDGKNIVLPLLKNMSELKDVLFGYLAHEASHVRDTDFDVVRQCKSAIEKSFLNLIEDIRIEKSIQEVFPGTQFTLTAMEDYIFNQGWTPVPTSDENEATQLQRYLYHRLYGEYLNRECYKALIPISRKVVEETFPIGFFIRLDGLLSKYMGSMASSSDALQIARGILKALKDAEEEKQNQPDSDDPLDSSSQDDQSNDGSSDSNDGDANGDSSQGDDQANQNDSPSSTGDSGNSLDSSNSHDASDPSQSDSSQGDDQGEIPQSGNGASLHERLLNESNLPEDAVSALRDSLVDQAVSDSQGKPVSINTSSVGKESGANGDSSNLSAGILASSAIRSRLLGLLAAKSRQQDRLHTRGKRVDGKRLTRIANGDTRVFIKRDEKQQVETSVHLLLDCSGSMHSIQHIANQATTSLALAVSSIPKCDIAVSMFPGIGGDVSPMIRRGQPVRAVLNRLDVSSTGGTPLAQAMLYAARDLASSKRPRKVLIVVTDGEPQNPGAVHYMNQLLEGYVDTYAIGIDSTAVSSFFKNWSVISDVKELQNALFTIAGKFLDLN